MKKKAGLITGLLVIVASLGFAGKTLKTSLINYVPFTEAMAATDSTVQIMGAPAPGTMHYDSGQLYFSMRDDSGTLMPVVFQGPKPDDMDTAMSKATKITAQGTYNKSRQVFVAENLLVKCPSKYQGANANGDRSYGASGRR